MPQAIKKHRTASDSREELSAPIRVVDRLWPPANWIADCAAEIIKPAGWKIIGPMLVGLTLIWGVFVGVMTYHSAHLLAQTERAEKSYYQLVGDLGHDSTRVRIGAIARIPEVMLLQVPDTTDLTALGAMRLTFGGQVRRTAPYHRDVKRLIRIHLAFLSSHPDKWSLAEMEAMLDIMRGLGSEGWYEARQKSTNTDRRSGLAWMWDVGHANDSEPAATLFQHIRLDGIDLKQTVLIQADLAFASLNKANLSYARLEHAILARSQLKFADLSSANLRFANMENVNAEQADLVSAWLDEADLKYANFANGRLQESSCDHCNLLGANLTGANLRRASLTGAYVENSRLDGAYLVGATMSRADFRFSSLRSADLSGADLREVDFRNSDLRGAKLIASDVAGVEFGTANLDGADLMGLRGLDAAKGWNDTNIAHLKGLSPATVNKLIDRGAVVIPNDLRWRAYKEAGKPHDRWREYASRN